jgi:hypothetical protein
VDNLQSTSNLTTHFAPVLADHAAGPFLTGGTRSALTLYKEGDLEIVWSPFDYVASAAKLVIVGITPGAQQAENAAAAFREALAGGCSPAEASRIAKLKGAFSGPMRNNLIAMLDHICVQHLVGVPTCAELFDPHRELVHLTSALRYPVFVRGANYNGTPDMLRTPCLTAMIDTHLANEARALPRALWLPLGDKPAAALRHLASHGMIDADQILHGLPHPSGANAERVACFLGRKAPEALSAKTRPEPILAGRDCLRAQVQRLRGAA